MSSEHTIKAFSEELRILKQSVSSLGRLAAIQVADAVASVGNVDVDLARKVIEREPQADRLEFEIENLVVRLFALRQPMAVDLRDILAALRAANELERICDYAEGIAKRLLAVAGALHLPTASLVRLGSFAQTMVADVVDAYERRDESAALAVWERDEALDQMYTSLFRELMTHILEDPRQLSTGTHLLFMARDLERIGDHATNIAEMVRYAVLGTRQTDPRPTADMTKSMIVTGDSATPADGGKAEQQ
ncbi:MAG: phosphate signaling complex protein PhoU [Rhodospirillales bacterium]|nr:phosphate signaling complex protein PhoU [Rhodospirillales bacterium]